MIFIKKRFKESEITNEINIIYNSILNNFRNFKYDNRKDFYVWLRVKDDIPGIKVLKSFLFNSDLKIFIQFKLGSVDGFYSDGKVVINTKFMEFQKYSNLFKNIQKTYLGSPDKLLLNYILLILKNSKSTIIHELTHAVDDDFMGGKINKNYIDFSEENIKSYANQEIEINARYTSTLDKIDIYRYYLDFKSFQKMFEKNFLGFNFLTKSKEQNLIQKLLKDYNMPLNSKKDNYIMNNLSGSFIFSLMNDTNDFKERLITSKVKVSEMEIKKYIKQSFEKVIHNSFDRNEIKSEDFIKNRYASIKIIYDKQKQYELLKSKNQNAFATKYKNKIDLFKRYLNISDNEFERFILNLKTLSL